MIQFIKKKKESILLIVIVAFLLSDAQQQHQHHNALHHRYDVTPDGRAVFRWGINTTNITFSVSVTTKGAHDAPPGWIAFGIGETTSGFMAGADIMVVEHIQAFATRSPTVTDMYVTEHGKPVTTCEKRQDWYLLGVDIARGAEGALSTTITATRRLDIDADEATVDRSFFPAYDPFAIDAASRPRQSRLDNRLVMAWGASAVLSPHSTDNAHAFQISLLGDAKSERQRFDALLDIPGVALGTMPISATLDTPEWSYIGPFTIDDMVGKAAADKGRELERQGKGGLWAVGFDLDMRGVDVHHLVYFSHWKWPSSIQDIFYVTAGYAEQGSWRMPNGTGRNLLTYPYYSVVMHHEPGRVKKGDTVALRTYYTFDDPGKDEAVIGIGFNPGVTLPKGDQTYRIVRPPPCTRALLSKPITIEREFFHMHFSGTVMAVTFSNATHGVYAHRRSEFPAYHQSYHYETDPIVVHPGDTITVECRYLLDKPKKLGFGGEDEMCAYVATFHPMDAVVTRKQGLATGRTVGAWSCDMEETVIAGPIPSTRRGFGGQDLTPSSSVTSDQCLVTKKGKQQHFFQPPPAKESEVFQPPPALSIDKEKGKDGKRKN